MVAQAMRQSAVPFRGVRAFDPMRDMHAVGLLLQDAFRDDLGFLRGWARVPGLRQVGAVFWAASMGPIFPERFTGFVWEEDKHVVGNVTLSPDEGRMGFFMISNVAVHEKYRRRGIARMLVLAAMDLAHQRGARWITLHVRPHNPDAVKLYADLGFETIDTEMTFTRKTRGNAEAGAINLHRLRSNERQAAFELARAVAGEKLELFRPLRPADFGLYWDDRLADWLTDVFTGQATQHYAYVTDNKLAATVTIRAQYFGTPHVIEIRVHPTRRGLIEDSLVGFALNVVEQFSPREVRAHTLMSQFDVVNALKRAGFVEQRGLTLMVYKV